MPSKHALLGPSGAHRWMLCPPSARWEATLPDTASEFAAEGTLAHSLAEVKLRSAVSKRRGHRGPLRGITKLRADPLYTEAMDGYTDTYVQTIMDLMDIYELEGEQPECYVEVQLDISRYVPECFGTSDAVIIAGNTVHVIDFKYGKGVPVDATYNPQMMMYALGAYDEFSMVEDLTEARMSIIQPRIDNTNSWDIDMEGLLLWARNELIPAGQLAFDGNGEFTPGETQCRFCRGRYRCRFNAAYMLRFASQYNATGRVDPELTDLEIGGILEQASALESWAQGMREMAQKRAMDGDHIPGWKLVEGRATRAISSKTEAAEKLLAAGYKPEQIFDLKGITALDSLVTKEKLKTILGDLIQTKTPKPALAKESDKREEYRPVKANDYFEED